MARVCKITGKRPMAGQNVSHANNKTKRRFNVNLQTHRYKVGGRTIKLKLSTKAIRLIDKLGIEKVIAKLKKKGE